MSIDFNDPHSIARWIAVHPERHLGTLRGLWKLWGSFRPQIEEAVRMHAQSGQGR